MHVELSKVRLHSLKDGAKHYLMIVLSILTALGLEAWIEHAHHTQAAAVATRQMTDELRANLEDVRSSYRTNAGRLEALKQFDAEITRDLSAGLSDASINQHIQRRLANFRLSLDWPVVADQAWDVAVANQSASWVDREVLGRYAAAYTRLRDAASWMTHDSTVLLDAPGMAAMQTRLQLGKPVAPVDFLTVLRQMIATSAETQSHLKQVEQQLERALSSPDGAPT